MSRTDVECGPLLPVLCPFLRPSLGSWGALWKSCVGRHPTPHRAGVCWGAVVWWDRAAGFLLGGGFVPCSLAAQLVVQTRTLQAAVSHGSPERTGIPTHPGAPSSAWFCYPKLLISLLVLKIYFFYTSEIFYIVVLI